MSAISNQPTNKNFLSPLGFKFLIKKTPNINWFVQSVNIPGIKVPVAPLDTPFVRIPFSGEQMTFEDLKITFRVDEDMKNYLEIYNWLIGTAFPETFEQYEGIGPSTTNTNRFLKPGQLKSDASLIIMNSAMNPIIDISFIDIAPIELSEVSFDTRLSDVNYVDATVVFSYLRYKINLI
jgi:hypothetical protein